MNALLLALLTACTTPSPAPNTGPDKDGEFPKVDLSTTGSAQTHQLYLDPLLGQGVFQLTDHNLPKATGARVREWPLGGRKVSIVPLPFPLDGDARETIGRDLKVVTDKGVELRYVSLGGGPNTWKIVKDRLEVKARGASKVVMTYSRADDLQDRRSLKASGLEPAAFVKSEFTKHGDTRPGLMLTSPSSATWQLDIPEEAVFTAFPALDLAPIKGDSDGMAIVLEVVEGEIVTEVDRKALKKSDLEKWTVDLSKWGGKQVGVRLRTEVTGSPDLDYAFVATPTVTGKATGEIRRVLVIGFDTTRPDHLGWYGYDRNSTPQLDEIANSSGVFTHAWTPAPRTRPSFRSATTGRYPLDAVGAENIGSVFQRHGFATAGFVANIHLQPRFDFNEGFDLWLFDGQHKAVHQVDLALKWFQLNEQRDSYMFLHIMDPHLLYHAPPPYTEQWVEDPDLSMPRTFTKNTVKQWGRTGVLTDQRKAHIEALYDGEMSFTSYEIGRLIHSLDKMPGKTMVVFHSDHGEEFWEHGGFEHNHTLYDEVTRALLWVRPPGGTTGGAVVSDQPATLADIAPTLYDYMGFDDLPATDGISLRPYLEGKSSIQRAIGIAHLRHGVDRWGVVHNGQKYIIETGTGKEAVYDLPDEHTDVLAKADVPALRQALLGAHPGLQAGQGWRVQIQDMAAFSITLPEPAVGAGVLDPDLHMVQRANLSWGEPPKRTAEEVGTVTLSDDKRTVRFTPGSKPEGLLWIRFDQAVSAVDVPLDVSGTKVQYRPAQGYIGATGAKLKISEGYLILPPPGEAARMAALRQGETARTSEETCRLCQLGYIEGEACSGC